MGVQIINPDIFNHFPAKEKFSIIDAYLYILKNDGLINGMNSSAYFWHDLGTPQSLDGTEIIVLFPLSRYIHQSLSEDCAC